VLSTLSITFLIEHVEQPHRRNKEMTDHIRKQVYQSLLARSNNGKLGKKDTTIVAQQFGLKIRAVQRVWKRGKTQLANSIPVVVSSLKKGTVGRNQIPVDLEALRDIPLKQRMTVDVTSWNFLRNVSNAKMWISKFRLEIECIIKI
jgi:hypothetical protein